MEDKKTIQLERKLHGKGARECRRCKAHRGLIRTFGLYICRRCFREIAEKMSFYKYS